MHARIDVLTHPYFWSLLTSSIFDWVVIVVSVRDTSMPLNTPLRPMSITLITVHCGKDIEIPQCFHLDKLISIADYWIIKLINGSPCRNR